MILVARAGTTGQVFERKVTPMGHWYIMPLEASSERIAYCAGPLLQNVVEGDVVVWDVGKLGKGFGWRKTT